MSSHGSMNGGKIESTYEIFNDLHRQQIAEAECCHAAYDDPPRSRRRWWRFWEREKVQSE